MSPQEPYPPRRFSVGNRDGAPGVLGFVIIGAFLFTWWEVGWWALLILLGFFFLPRFLLFSGAFIAVGGRREVNAQLMRVARLENERNVVGLINMLDSEVRGATKYSIVRDHAASALARLRDPRAIPYLVNLVHDQEEMVRMGAVTALGALKAKDAEGALLEALRDRAPIVRYVAADVLGRIGAHDAIPSLRKALDTDPDPEVRLATVESLVLLGDRESRNRVPDALKAVSWRARSNPRRRRLREAVETGEPLTPWIRPTE